MDPFKLAQPVLYAPHFSLDHGFHCHFQVELASGNKGFVRCLAVGLSGVIFSFA